MFGLFSNPKCPYCGSELEETGYSAPYPSHRCHACIKRNRQASEIKQLRKDIDDLKRNQKEIES